MIIYLFFFLIFSKYILITLFVVYLFHFHLFIYFFCTPWFAINAEQSLRLPLILVKLSDKNELQKIINKHYLFFNNF